MIPGDSAVGIVAAQDAVYFADLVAGREIRVRETRGGASDSDEAPGAVTTVSVPRWRSGPPRLMNESRPPSPTADA